MLRSLVGSEMCIRDRCDLGLAVIDRDLIGNQRIFCADAQDGTVGHHAVPVSYTHLTLPTIYSV